MSDEDKISYAIMMVDGKDVRIPLPSPKLNSISSLAKGGVGDVLGVRDGEVRWITPLEQEVALKDEFDKLTFEQFKALKENQKSDDLESFNLPPMITVFG